MPWVGVMTRCDARRLLLPSLAVMRNLLTSRVRTLLVPALAVLALVATPMNVSAGIGGLSLVQGGFTNPLYVTHAGDSRLFVVEKGGLIKIVGGGTFLDVSTEINQAGERGLLGLAFDPNYASNGLFYIQYNRSDGDVVLSERRRSSGNPDLADPNYKRTLLRIEHSSASNHNGGWIGFQGNLLYIAVGDGGDTPQTAQDLGSLKGKILRINPHNPPGAKQYSIPASNPFVGKAGKDAIWAYGFRNPWRCSFDRGTGQLWCGDVGQGQYEEVDRPEKGKNYGWKLLEGFHYYSSPGHTQGDLCAIKCKTKPIFEYPHSVDGDDNDAVTGGYVSRRVGSGFTGYYLFGDYGSGRIWAVSAGSVSGDPLPSPIMDTNMGISSFGEGSDGKLYVVDISGSVWRFDGS
jgi:glucose/arabinose dehydrogenase